MFSYATSGMLYGITYVGVAEQVRDWIAKNVPGMDLLYPNSQISDYPFKQNIKNSSTEGYVLVGLFRHNSLNAGIVIGVKASQVNNEITYSNKIYIAAGSNVYVNSEGNPYITLVVNALSESDCLYGMNTEKVTSSSNETTYGIGCYYVSTKKNGVIVGLYHGNEENGRIFMDYPAYVGEEENEFSMQKVTVALQVNKGARAAITTSLASSSSAKPETDYSTDSLPMSVASVTPINQTVEGSSVAIYKMLLMNVSYISSGLPRYSVTFSPLYGLQPGTIKLYHVDEFYAGSFNSTTYPPIMEEIEIDGQKFVTISKDGVALKTTGLGDV